MDLFRYRNPVMTNQSPESLSCDISPPTFYLVVNVRNFYCTHSCMLRSIEEMASGSRCRVEYDYYDYERALINQAANHLGYSSLKREQEAAIFYFVVGNDVFVSLPTGFGKSLCYGVLPFVFDLKRFGDMTLRRSIVVVISPLIALMKDQVATFSEKGIIAGCITTESSPEEKKTAKEGGYQLIFFSPEAILCTPVWRTAIQSARYQENVVALVIDEAHCVHKW